MTEEAEETEPQEQELPDKTHQKIEMLFMEFVSTFLQDERIDQQVRQEYGNALNQSMNQIFSEENEED